MAGEFMFSLLTPLVAFTCGGLFGYLSYRWPAYPYLFTLSLAFFYLALSFITFDLGVLSPPGGVNFAGNGLVLVAILLACSSTLVRVRARQPLLFYAVVLVMTAAAFTWFVYGYNSITARILVMSAGMVAIALGTFVLLVRAGMHTLPDRLFATGVLLAVLTMLARPILLFIGALDPNEGGNFTASDYWQSVRALTPFFAMTVSGVFVLALVKDIVDGFRAEADRDYLTGLLNRRGFETAAIARLAAPTGRRPALLLADIDDFKSINDSFGHKVGDIVIAAVADVLVRHGGATLAGRIGGEEYALFYAGADAEELAFRAAEIQHALSRLAVPGLPPDHPLTLSMGLHASPGAETLDQMLGQADQLLYRAKNAGKNRAYGDASQAVA